MSSCLTDKGGGTLIALRTDGRKYNPENFVSQKKVTYNKDYYALKHITDIFKFNGQQIRKDFDLITKSRKSASLSSTNRILCPENVFAEPGVKAEFAVINASEGPVYLGENSSVGENSVIKGPFAMCENAQVKISAKIYDATTLGPYCKVGGEVENTVFFGYSNKAHDGFVGNSIIGHWCNMGADTNTSNLKNNYSPVRLFSIKDNCYISTDEMFCGTVMGDYSKCGINTMFNTGTVVGVCANVARGGFPEKYIPSFSWITQKDNVLYDYDKAVQTACVVQNRRGKTMTQQEKDVLYHIFTQAENNFKSK